MRTDSAKPTLIVANNYRLFVADAVGVDEVHIPAMAKALYIMLLRNPDGVAFDDRFKARKELIDAYYEITHCPVAEEELQRALDLTEPPTGNIEAMCEVIRKCFILCLGKKRCQPFLVDSSNPNAVRVALSSESVVWG